MCPPPKTGSFPIRAGLWSLFLMVMRGGARGRGAVPAGSLRLSVARSLSLSLSLPSSPSLPRSLSALSSPSRSPRVDPGSGPRGEVLRRADKARSRDAGRTRLGALGGPGWGAGLEGGTPW